jgi:hypothetical protein
LEKQSKGDKALLRTVVQVALDSVPGYICRLHDSSPGGLHLGQLFQDPGVQRLHFHGHADGCCDCAKSLRPPERCDVVFDRGDRLPSGLDASEFSPWVGELFEGYRAPG